MPRYIDVDALIAEIESNSRKTWSEDINTVFWGNAVKIKDNIKRCIERQPTVDVVPREKVDDVWELNAMLLEAGQEWQKRYESLAREIFAELAQYGICEQLYMGGVCLTEQEFEELKKKYGVE